MSNRRPPDDRLRPEFTNTVYGDVNRLTNFGHVSGDVYILGHPARSLEEIKPSELELRYAPSMRDDVAKVISALRSRNVLYAELDNELWSGVFASLKDFRDTFAGLSGRITSKGPQDVKALVLSLLEAVMSFLRKHETSYIRFMSSDYQHLGAPHRERNWPGTGVAWRDLLYLRQLLLAAIKPLNFYAEDGDAIDWTIDSWKANLPEPRSVLPETAPFIVREERPYSLRDSKSYFDEALVRTVFWSPRYSYQYIQMTCYGTKGLPLLLVPLREQWSPRVEADYEANGVISSLANHIKDEKLKIYSIKFQYNPLDSCRLRYGDRPDSRDDWSLKEFDNTIVHEAIPIIARDLGEKARLFVGGISEAALLAATAYLRHPDLFEGLIGINGLYDVRELGDFHDVRDRYFFSIFEFLPNLNKHHHLDLMRSRQSIYLCAGQRDEPTRSRTLAFSRLLDDRGIGQHLDLWGYDVDDHRDWRSKMLVHTIDKVLQAQGTEDLKKHL